MPWRLFVVYLSMGDLFHLVQNLVFARNLPRDQMLLSALRSTQVLSLLKSGDHVQVFVMRYQSMTDFKKYVKGLGLGRSDREADEASICYGKSASSQEVFKKSRSH